LRGDDHVALLHMADLENSECIWKIQRKPEVVVSVSLTEYFLNETSACGLLSKNISLLNLKNILQYSIIENSLYLHFFVLPSYPKAKFRNFFHLFKFHSSESCFTCPRLRASGLTRRLWKYLHVFFFQPSCCFQYGLNNISSTFSM
jgi:hypothetical protein